MLDSELTFYVTEKLDGSSATYVLDRGDFLVSSRNLNLAEDPGNSFWQVAREREIEERMICERRARTIANLKFERWA